MKHGEYTHIEIPADDPTRAQRFYEGLFGWLFSSMPEFPDYFMYVTPAGQEGVGGAIGKRNEQTGAVVRNFIHVDSIEGSLPRVTELGGTVVAPKAEVPGMGWYAVINDSEGNEIALWETLPRT
jgi:hypothetical protein